MKKMLIVLALLAIVGCVPTQAQVKAPVVTQPTLTLDEVGVILMEADKQLTEKNCTAKYLNENKAYIWARCPDGYKVISLAPLVKAVQQQKQAQEGVKPSPQSTKPEKQGKDTK